MPTFLYLCSLLCCKFLGRQRDTLAFEMIDEVNIVFLERLASHQYIAICGVSEPPTSSKAELETSFISKSLAAVPYLRLSRMSHLWSPSGYSLAAGSPILTTSQMRYLSCLVAGSTPIEMRTKAPTTKSSNHFFGQYFSSSERGKQMCRRSPFSAYSTCFFSLLAPRLALADFRSEYESILPSSDSSSEAYGSGEAESESRRSALSASSSSSAPCQVHQQ